VMHQGSCPWPCRFDGNFGYFSDDDEDDLRKFIIPLCIALPLNHIRSLRLDVKAVFPLDTIPWHDLFAHTLELRVLATQLPDTHLRRLFGALASKSSSTPVVVQHLDELHLLGYRGRARFGGFTPRLEVTGLLDTLRERAQNGLYLKRITLGTDIDASNAYVDELRKAVGEVTLY